MGNNKTFESLVLAQEYADGRSAELSEKLGTKVTPIIFYEKKNTNDAGAPETWDFAIAYLKKPTLAIKCQVLDRMTAGEVSEAQKFLLYNVIIKEESDPIFFSTEQTDEVEEILMGAYIAAGKMVKVKSDVTKKN